MFDPNMDPRLYDQKAPKHVDSQESFTPEETQDEGEPISDKMEMEQEGSSKNEQLSQMPFQYSEPLNARMDFLKMGRREEQSVDNAFGTQIMTPFWHGNMGAGPYIKQTNKPPAKVGGSYNVLIPILCANRKPPEVAQALLDNNKAFFNDPRSQEAASRLTTIVDVSEEFRKRGAKALWTVVLRLAVSGKIDFSNFAQMSEAFKFISGAQDGVDQVIRLHTAIHTHDSSELPPMDQLILKELDGEAQSFADIESDDEEEAKKDFIKVRKVKKALYKRRIQQYNAKQLMAKKVKAKHSGNVGRSAKTKY